MSMCLILDPAVSVQKLHMSKAGKGAASKRAATKEVVNSELLTAHQRAVASIRQRKQLKGSQDKSTMDRLKQFSAMLDTRQPTAETRAPTEPAEPDARNGAASAQAAPVARDGAGGGKAKGLDEKTKGLDEKTKGPEDAAYDGKVNSKIDHASYLPAAWRVRLLLRSFFWFLLGHCP